MLTSTIWDYIAAENLAAADKVIAQIREAIESLVSFPHQGHVRSDLASSPLRFHTVRDYLIVYGADDQPLRVVAVLHGRRNPRVMAAILRTRK